MNRTRAIRQWKQALSVWLDTLSAILNLVLTILLSILMLPIAAVGFLAECTVRALKAGWKQSIKFWEPEL